MECVYGCIQIFTSIFRDMPRYLIIMTLLVVGCAYEEQHLTAGVFSFLASGLYYQTFCHTYKTVLEQTTFPQLAFNIFPSVTSSDV